MPPEPYLAGMYQRIISELAPASYDPRHIEAFMRVQYGTLDHLSRDAFKDEIKICTAAIDQCGPAEAEELALSMGL